jgi:hypothetical protein
MATAASERDVVAGLHPPGLFDEGAEADVAQHDRVFVLTWPKLVTEQPDEGRCCSR